ncbi:MAG: hypothetical protein ACK5N0_13205 [Synechococcaceae cyanobacterium]
MASHSTPTARAPSVAAAGRPVPPAEASGAVAVSRQEEPILCDHCGRSASNGLTCIGMCVADSGY